MNDVGEIREELGRAFQYHTEHNCRPPSRDEAFGKVRLSPEIENAISDSGESTYALSRRPAIQPGPFDDSLPLQEYFISSSHNTYLLSQQLIGKSSAASYSHVLANQGRCVEIDVWPSDNGLIVTHGHTLVEGVPFFDVCRLIGESVVPECWPVLVSLECHVPASGQRDLVQQMVDAWGDKLVKGPLRGVFGSITPADLKGRILLMVEYYPPGGGDPEEENGDTVTQQEDTNKNWFLSFFRSTERAEARISDELAEYGYYARSMKPKEGWLSQIITDPANILINISESACMELLPASLGDLISHSCNHLRRIFPKGTRIDSSNLDPLVFWRNGSQIASLNWQVYDTGMHLNEAMFVGSPGWVPKPREMRKKIISAGASLGEKAKHRIVAEIVGVSSLPAPNEREGKSFHSYIKAQLFLSSGELSWRSQTLETQHDPQSGADVLWKEQFEWYYEDDDLSFIRLMICEDEVGRDDCIVVFCAKFDHLVKGQWVLLRMLSNQGKNSGATVLSRFMVDCLR